MTYRQAAISSPIQSESLSYHQAQNSYPRVLKIDKSFNVEWVYTPEFELNRLAKSTRGLLYMNGSLYMTGNEVAPTPHVIRVNLTGEAIEWSRSATASNGFIGVCGDGTNIYTSRSLAGTVYKLDPDNTVLWSRSDIGTLGINGFGSVNGGYLYTYQGKFNANTGADYVKLSASSQNSNGNAVADGSYVWFAGLNSSYPKLSKRNDDASLGHVWTYTPSFISTGPWHAYVAVESSEAYFIYGGGGESWVEEISSGGSSNWSYQVGGSGTSVTDVLVDSTHVFVTVTRNADWDDAASASDYATIIKLDRSGNYVAHIDTVMHPSKMATDGTDIYVIAAGGPGFFAN